MAIVKIVDPVTRIEGHLKVEVVVDTVGGVQQVVDARATGTLFRGFEKLLVGRAPADAQHITERICGVCPVSHGMAAVLAQEAAARMKAPANGRTMRNLVLGSNYLQSHILHFYHLAAQDFVAGPDMPPWQPSWDVDRRVTGAAADTLVAHYVRALDMRRKAHEMGALFGGRLPHPPSFAAGGITSKPTSARIATMKKYLSELRAFIEGVYLPDVQAVGEIYQDYFSIGAGPGNLLAFGVFDLDAAGSRKLFRRGHVIDGAKTPTSVSVASITEHVRSSWYADSTSGANPARGATKPQYPKGDAYSWLKAPRYAGKPHETGPLARMWVNGDYRRGISVMDRHVARALEAAKVAKAMQKWVATLRPSVSAYKKPSMPSTATARGLTEAPRGALGHWVRLKAGKIAAYQVITPTCWNVSPRDDAGVRGPMEEALLGTPVQDPDRPIEVLRVIHSFDPCLSCAVHVMRPGRGGELLTVAGTHAGGTGGHGLTAGAGRGRAR